VMMRRHKIFSACSAIAQSLGRIAASETGMQPASGQSVLASRVGEEWPRL
jgi:hypothetical protein